MDATTTTQQPLSRLNIFATKGVQMRTFHLTWLTFFFCFFGWFGIAPLMPLVREQLHLDKGQVGNIVIASVSATILARLLMGKLCDTIGPRLAYTLLLAVGLVRRQDALLRAGLWALVLAVAVVLLGELLMPWVWQPHCWTK